MKRFTIHGAGGTTAGPYSEAQLEALHRGLLPPFILSGLLTWARTTQHDSEWNWGKYHVTCSVAS